MRCAVNRRFKAAAEADIILIAAYPAVSGSGAPGVLRPLGPLERITGLLDRIEELERQAS
jgi:hypothetical protein